MSDVDPDELLELIRERASEDPQGIVSSRFRRLDKHLRNGGPLPSDWWLSQEQRPSTEVIERVLQDWSSIYAYTVANPDADRLLKAGNRLAQFIRELTGVADVDVIAAGVRAPSGALPVIEPCPHCCDSAGDPTGYCNRQGCPVCKESREASEGELTCGRCGGMCSVQVAPS
jgi:hypothetical protein